MSNSGGGGANKAVFAFTRVTQTAALAPSYDPRLQAIVVHLLLCPHSDFSFDFFYVFRASWSPQQVLDALLQRAEPTFAGFGLSPVKSVSGPVSSPLSENDRKSMWSALQTLLSNWLGIHWLDYDENKGELLRLLQRFIGQYEHDPVVGESALLLKELVDLAQRMKGGRKGTTDAVNQASNSKPTILLPSLTATPSSFDEPLLPSLLPKEAPCPMRKVHPEEMARQITLVQWQVFSGLNLAKALPPDSEAQQPQGGQIPDIQGSNGSAIATAWSPFGEWNSLCGHIQRWAATSVSTISKQSERVKTLSFLIEVAYSLYRIGNYAGCSCVVDGLKLLPLPQTWAALTSKTRSAYDSLASLLRLLWTDTSKILHAGMPHIPVLDAFTQHLFQLGLAQPRFVSAPAELSSSGLGSQSTIPTFQSLSSTGINTRRLKSEVMILTKLKLFQSRPFPFIPVPWISNLIIRSAPLSIWTIQENCEMLEPPKYASNSLASQSKKTSSPRRIISSSHLNQPLQKGPSPPHKSGASSPPHETGAFSLPGSPLSSPRDYAFDMCSIGSSPSSSWVDLMDTHHHEASSTKSSPTHSTSSHSLHAPRTQSSPTLQVPASNSQPTLPTFPQRRALHREMTHSESELEKNGYFVFSTPPPLTSERKDKNSPVLTSNIPPWWAMLDEDREDEVVDESCLRLMLEYLPYPEYDSIFSISSFEASLIAMKSSKLIKLFKAVSKKRFRKDFMFAAPSHSKGLKLNTYRICHQDASAYVQMVHSVTLTNTSNAPLDWEFAKDSPYAHSACLTTNHVFVSYSPASGILAAGKSTTVKITIALLEQERFCRIVKICAYWHDLQYASFVPLLILQQSPNMLHSDSTSGSEPSTPRASIQPGEGSTRLSTNVSMLSAQQNSAATGVAEFSAYRQSSLLSQHLEDGMVPASLQSALPVNMAAALNASLVLSDAFWKIPLEDLKILKRLGGNAASVSLASLHGADVVVKRWDLGSLDPVPEEFIGELEALRSLRHPNLVSFLGGLSTRGVAFIVMEYLPRGALSDVLQRGELSKKKRGMKSSSGTHRQSSAAPNSAMMIQPPSSSNSAATPLSFGSQQPSGTPAPTPLASQRPPLRSAVSFGSSPTNYYGMNIQAKPYSVAPAGQPTAPTTSNTWAAGNVQTNSSATGASASSNPHSTTVAQSPGKASPLGSHPSTSALMKTKLKIAADIAKGMAYMHYRHRLHRDLKSLNILVDESYGAKIADLGSSRNWAAQTQMTSGVGTYDWIAPEVISSHTYTLAADVFSYGLILWELIHEKFPDRPMDDIAAGRIPPIDPQALAAMFRDASSPLGIEFVSLLQRCCSIDSTRRPPFTDIVIILEQMLTTPTAASPRQASVVSGQSNASSSVHATTSRPSSGDAWVRALKTNSSSSLYQNAALYQSPASSPLSSPMTSSPPTPPPVDSYADMFETHVPVDDDDSEDLAGPGLAPGVSSPKAMSPSTSRGHIEPARNPPGDLLHW